MDGVMSEMTGMVAGRARIGQRTLSETVRCEGIGLHGGKATRLSIGPAPVDSGIRFERTDLTDRDPVVPATWRHVVSTNHCTTLGNAAGATVGTVEHLMAALAGCGVDNATIRLDGPEVPIMDGSAAPFVFLIECAGITEQESPRRAIRVRKPVALTEKGRQVSLTPGDGFSVRFEIDFASGAIARQEAYFRVTASSFKAELARARTFGMLEEVDHLRAAGLAQGGSLDNAVVVAGDLVLNEEGLRFDNEFVRHKALDAVGDLALAGAPLIGHFHGVRSGHRLTHRLLTAFFAQDDNWEWVDFPGLRVVSSEAPVPAPANPFGRLAAAV
jgi:UDP-3-O-[3-hydroxymyristoyl] N-acetylglucosamine deacetylase